MFTFYNQNLERFTRNGCSVYTLFTIIQIQWGIKVTNDFIIQALQEAEKDKAFYETWGAYFGKIYNWFASAILRKANVKVKVRTVNILSDEFETLYNLDYAFGLGLKHAGLWYRKARKDGIITIEESQKGNYRTYGHNHTYFKGLIVDTLGTVDKPIKMSLRALREAVKNGIYYPNARTLILEDRPLDYYLKYFQKGGIIKDVEVLSKKKQVTINKALQLRTFKKILKAD